MDQFLGGVLVGVGITTLIIVIAFINAWRKK